MSLNSTIADLILEKGRAQAAGVAGSGQAWGNTLSNIGQTVGSAIQTATDPMQQLRAAQLSQFKHDQQGRQVLASAIKQYGDDNDAITKSVSVAGFPEQANSWLKVTTENSDNLAKLKKLQEDMQQHQLQTIGDLAYTAKTPHDFAASLGVMAQHGLIDEQTAHQLADQFNQDPDAMAAAKTKYLPFSPKFQSHQAELDKPVVLPPTPPGAAPAVQVINGQTVATGGTPAPKPMNKDQALSYQADPNATPEQKAMAKSWLDAAALAESNPNEPITVKTMENGKPVEKVMTRSDALKQGSFQSQPPASVIVQNNAAAAAANAPPIDASRPTGPEGNKINPTTGLTKNAEYQNALMFALTGKIQSAGMSGAPGQRLAASQMIQNKAAAIAAEAGVDMPTVQAEYRANSGALSKIVPIAAMTAASAGAAKDNLQLALDASGDINRTSSKFVNKPWQVVQREMTAAKDLSTFDQYIYTAAREYAKVVSGSAASTQGLTDTAAKEATKLISAAQSKETFAAVAKAMQNDMDNVTRNQTKEISNVSGVLGNFFGALNGTPAAPSSGPSPAPKPASVPANVAAALKGASAGRHTLSDGSVWVIGADGSVTKG